MRRYMKRCSTSPVIREMQIKTTIKTTQDCDVCVPTRVLPLVDPPYHGSCGETPQWPFELVLLLLCPLEAWFFIISWLRLPGWAQRGSHCLWIFRTPGVSLDSLYATSPLPTAT